MSRGRRIRGAGGEAGARGGAARGTAGFTLIELMVSVLIAAFTVLGLAGGNLSAMRANRVSEKLSHATALGQRQLALLKQQAEWGSVSAGNETREAFDVRWTIQGTGPQPGTTIVRVRVSWTGQGAHALELETIVRDG